MLPLDDDIPAPEAVALQHSERLQQLIRDEIKNKGAMPFERFMQLALYAPGLGYYTAGSHKFGAAGDFVTAPEISPLFSQCLANQCAEVLAQSGGSILEFGAGSGRMAADLLQHLEQIGQLPDSYLILDLSPDLKQRQQQTIAEQVPHLLERVQWIESLPAAGFRGVMLGNEVLDAMPVSVFRKTETGLQEKFVELEDEGQIVASWQAVNSQITDAVTQLEIRLGAPLPVGYESEINLSLDGWLQSLADCLQQGAVLLIDYGYAQHEYYHAERSMGTLICHYRHRAHDDVFKFIGLQDITANVDFSAVKRAGEAAGLQLAGYTTQSAFLLGNGLEQLLAQLDPNDTQNFLRTSQAVKVLMMPSEMGERFKVIAFTRDMDARLSGFSMRDFSDRL
jgi:SAM-dependent MidA family methyltransferase